MKMKKNLITMLSLGLCAILSAQGTKQMNSIKRSSLYLYAEATMATAQEAYEVASDLLLIQVKEYADSKKAFRDKDILIRNISQQKDSIQLQRGDMVKVFLYVKKSDIIGAENVTLVNNTSTTESADGEAVPSNIEAVDVPLRDSESASKSETKQADPSLQLSTSWQQKVVEQLLAAESFSSAKSQLNRLKAEFKIKKTGPMTDCSDPSAVFILLGKNGKVETVLGPGATERTDFKTLTKTNASIPSGMDAVWFTFAK